MSEESKGTAVADGAEKEAHVNSVKEEIYVKIDKFVKEKTGKRIGKAGGREIFDLVIGESFQAAVLNENFRFNAGLGSLRVREYTAGSRRLPNGSTTTFGTRKKVRYEEGVVVQDMIGGKTLAEATRRGKKGKGGSEASTSDAEGSPVELD